jgi:hypothetical protein
MNTLRLTVFALCLSAMISGRASAQSPDPRDYEVGYFVPSKTTIINTYLRHQTGTKNRNYTADAAVFRATYIVKFGNLVLTPFDALLPVVDQRGFVPLSNALSPFNPAFSMLPSDLNVTLHATGVGDLTFLPTIGHGFVQNAADHTHTWYALTTYITAPTGKYDPERLLNVGSNRWTINPLLVLGQRFLRAVTLEAMANVAFYTDNDEYRVRAPALAGQNLKLKQERSIGAALHLAIDLHPMFFVGTSYLITENGRRDFVVPTANGNVTRGETASNTVQTFRLNFGLRVTPQTLVLFQWNEDVAGTPSAATGRFMGIRLSHAFFAPVQKPATRAVPTDPENVKD